MRRSAGDRWPQKARARALTLGGALSRGGVGFGGGPGER